MNIVCLGAHPDDGEVFAGGVAVKWARLGHRVVLVSLTNGDIGHHEMAGGPLALRRAEEARKAARRAGVESLVLDYHDGELAPTLEVRKRVVEIIRQYEADMVLTHRPNDYHPDHRYTSIVVQDAAFMVTVPHFCPHAPVLRRNPVFLFLMDRFMKPVPFQPDIAVDITDVMEVKWAMLDAMESQMYEWLPWLEGAHDTVPQDAEQRRQWLKTAWAKFFAEPACLGRAALEKRYGPECAANVEYAELFEICEYGRQPSEAEIRQYFPFFPAADA
jgi:LmbE family N-acetylglucosaminyl deacetylase